MSRWAAAFAALCGSDTLDTVDTVAAAPAAGSHSVNSVDSVMRAGDADAAPAAAPAAIATGLVPPHSVNSVNRVMPSDSVEAPPSAYLLELRAFCAARAVDLAGAYDDPEVLADRQAIAAEAPLPPAGSAERERHDRSMGATLAGLLAAARRGPPAPEDAP